MSQVKFQRSIDGVDPIGKFKDDKIPRFLLRNELEENRTPKIANEQTNLQEKVSSKFAKVSDSWIEEELQLSMNKLSLTGVVIGLMVLGALFFSTGFVTGIMMGPKQSSSDSHNSWANVNAAQTQGHSLPKGGSGMEANLAEGYFRRETGQLTSGVMRYAPNVPIPSAVMPFAREEQGQIVSRMQNYPQQSFENQHKEGEIGHHSVSSSNNPSHSGVNKEPKPEDFAMTMPVSQDSRAPEYNQFYQGEGIKHPEIYSLQIGVYEQEAVAIQQQQSLNKLGHDAYIVTANNGNRHVYILRSGAYYDRNDAQAAAKALRQYYRQDPGIVQVSQ